MILSQAVKVRTSKVVLIPTLHKLIKLLMNNSFIRLLTKLLGWLPVFQARSGHVGSHFAVRQGERRSKGNTNVRWFTSCASWLAFHAAK